MSRFFLVFYFYMVNVNGVNHSAFGTDEFYTLDDKYPNKETMLAEITVKVRKNVFKDDALPIYVALTNIIELPERDFDAYRMSEANFEECEAKNK